MKRVGHFSVGADGCAYWTEEVCAIESIFESFGRLGGDRDFEVRLGYLLIYCEHLRGREAAGGVLGI